MTLPRYHGNHSSDCQGDGSPEHRDHLLALSALDRRVLLGRLVRDTQWGSAIYDIRVSPAGVAVENSRYGVLLLNWADVTRATYSRFGKMITLESPKLSKPLAIMNLEARGVAPEFSAARSIISAALSDRWSERRL